MASRILIAVTLALILVACNKSTTKSVKAPPPPALSSDSVESISVLASAKDGSIGGEIDSAVYVGLAGSQPYYLQGPYASVLPNCVIAPAPEYSCSLNVLPFMVSDAQEPTVDLVLSRLVVSHRWMGDRFHEMLLNLPADMLQLFKSVTAVVIADDIRPSSFNTITGAMYIDPVLLWQTQDEKSIFRLFAGQAQEVDAEEPLSFRSWSRYVKDNRPASQSFSVMDDSERGLKDTLLPMAALLFHELAHANDFFPAERIVHADASLSVYEVAGFQVGNRPSDYLQAHSKLSSARLTHLANIMYLNEGAFTTEDLGISAQNIAAEFDLQPANDDYAFVHQFEDAAMLFEEVMMRYHFQVDRDVAYLDVPKLRTEGECNGYTVAWGMRNRSAREEIKERAQIVVEAIIPKPHWSAYFASLAPPQYLPAGSGWCDSLNMEGLTPNVTSPSSHVWFDTSVDSLSF